MPVRPEKVTGSPPRATPRRASSARPRVTRAARVLSPKPMPSAMPQAMAITFLRAPPSSQPTTSWLVYTRNVPVVNRLCSSSARSTSVVATTLAVGWPATISSTRFGPVSTAQGWPGATSATTSVIRRRVPCSTPLVRLTTGVAAPRKGRPADRTDRNPWDGTAITTTSAPRQRFLQRRRGPQGRRQVEVGQVVGVPVVGVDGPGQLLPAGPQHGGETGRGHGGHRRPPRAGAHDRHLHDSGTFTTGPTIPSGVRPAPALSTATAAVPVRAVRCTPAPAAAVGVLALEGGHHPALEGGGHPTVAGALPGRRRVQRHLDRRLAPARHPDLRRWRGRRSRWGPPPSARSSRRPAGGETRRGTLRR